MTLDQLRPGNDAVIASVDCGEGALRKHILDMGLTPGTAVSMVKAAPLGDPLELRLRGYELTLRKADAARITLAEAHFAREQPSAEKRRRPHPSAGESVSYRTGRTASHIRPGQPVHFALAGNQNCGKTTLFNQLTGANQHVGNLPGVTVDRKDGVIRGHSGAIVTDLPGIYSLSPYTSEEIVTREFLLRERPAGIINILDATSMERNLYLTMQLMELEIPMVLALNMMDEVRANGGTIQVRGLETALGIPVVPISAAKNEGVDELIGRCLQAVRCGQKPGQMEFWGADEAAEPVCRCIHAVSRLIEDHAKREDIPVQFAATKLIEGDRPMLEALKLAPYETDALERILVRMEQERGLDRMAALADMRFRQIAALCGETVTPPKESRARLRSRRIDRVLTGKYTAIPAFVGIMALVFCLTFGLIGAWLSECLELGIGWFTDLCDRGLTALGISPVVHSLMIDGVFAGVGSVLRFLPIIVVLFFFLSLLEDSGYMARVAFVMDKPMRKIGLSGRSLVPMLIGFGCSVPAIMATRTLPSGRDRRLTVLLTPFMSCSAKLPVYALLTAAFFPEHGALVMIALYFAGIVVGILYALMLKQTVFRGEPAPFVLELPDYRLPGAKNVLRLIGEKARDFVTRAFTVIFLASVIVWFLQTFDERLTVVTNAGDSLLALVGSWIAPVFRPMGLGDWRISTALITGLTAKESVVSTLTVLLGGSTAGIGQMFTSLTAAAFLVFSLLYTPCVAAVAAVKRELGGRWALIMMVSQCAVAWLAAFLVYWAGSLLC